MGTGVIPPPAEVSAAHHPEAPVWDHWTLWKELGTSYPGLSSPRWQGTSHPPSPAPGDSEWRPGGPAPHGPPASLSQAKPSASKVEPAVVGKLQVCPQWASVSPYAPTVGLHWQSCFQPTCSCSKVNGSRINWPYPPTAGEPGGRNGGVSLSLGAFGDSPRILTAELFGFSASGEDGPGPWQRLGSCGLWSLAPGDAGSQGVPSSSRGPLPHGADMSSQKCAVASLGWCFVPLGRQTTESLPWEGSADRETPGIRVWQSL